jgi:hypothetical protein
VTARVFSNGISVAHAAELLFGAIPSPPKAQATALDDHVATDHADAGIFIRTRLDGGFR